MSIPSPLTLVGATGSPYTRKMVALLRYRRIPYSIIWGDPAKVLDEMGIEKPTPSLLPTFLIPNKNNELEATTDSTPIIRRLEKEFSDRSVIPSDPALSYINYLLEDFGDEWCTKYMFHYRWHRKLDADNAKGLLPFGMMLNLPSEQWKQMKEFIGKRQIDRLWVVGSNETTAPTIEASYERFLEILEKHFEIMPFLLGHRPSSADFAIYGQLSQLIGFDPTPRSISHRISPRTVAWIDLMEDQCGLEPSKDDWKNIADLPETIIELLTELGRVYVPTLLANEKAVLNGDKMWESKIDGCTWKQQSFPYQAKCLKWIKEEFKNISETDQARVSKLIVDTGCELLVNN